jgi:hypothetical protein
MAKENGVERTHDVGLAKEEFDRLVEPTRLRTKRQANVLFVIFVGLGVVVAFVLGAVALANATPDENIRDDILLVLSFSLFFCVVGFTARQMILRDLLAFPQLRDLGSTFKGRVVRQRVRPSGIHHLHVAWDENGRQCGASFDAIGLAAPIGEDVQVRAVPKRSPVAVAINGRLYVAVRATPRP